MDDNNKNSVYNNFLKDLSKETEHLCADSPYNFFYLFDLTDGIIQHIEKIGEINKKLTTDEIDEKINTFEDGSIISNYFATIYKHDIPEKILSKLIDEAPNSTYFFARPDLTPELAKQILKDTDLSFMDYSLNIYNPTFFSEKGYALFMDTLFIEEIVDGPFQQIFQYYDFNKLSQEQKEQDLKKIKEFIDGSYCDERLISKLINIESFPNDIRNKLFEKGYDPEKLATGTKEMCKSIYDSNIDISFLDVLQPYHKPYVFNDFFRNNITNMPDSCLYDFIERCIKEPSKFHLYKSTVFDILRSTKDDDLMLKVCKNRHSLSLAPATLLQLPLGPKSCYQLLKDPVFTEPIMRTKFFDMVSDRPISDIKLFNDMIMPNGISEKNKEFVIDRIKLVIASQHLTQEYEEHIKNLNIPILNDLITLRNDFMNNVYSEEDKNFNFFTTILTKSVESSQIKQYLLKKYPPPKYSTLLTPECSKKYLDLMDKYTSLNIDPKLSTSIRNIYSNFKSMDKSMSNFYKHKPECFEYKYNPATNEKIISFNPYKVIYTSQEEIDKFKVFIKSSHSDTFLKSLKTLILNAYTDPWFKTPRPQTSFMLYKSAQVYDLINERIKELENTRNRSYKYMDSSR